MASSVDISSIYQRPAELLQRLIRFDTTNPPGNETVAANYIRDALAAGRSARYLLPDSVLAYIVENGLYGSTATRVANKGT